MKRLLSPVLCFSWALSGAPQAAQPTATPQPAPPAATAKPGAPAPAPTRTMTPQEEEQYKKYIETQEAIRQATGGQIGRDATPDTIVVNPVTGQREQKIAKEPQYYVVRGRLYNSLVRASKGIPLLREDEEFFYVEAPKELVFEKPDEGLETLQHIYETSTEEGQSVAPPVSSSKLTFVDDSKGLPDSGMWRQTFGVGDLDGQAGPEIITPPPRMTGMGPQVFKRTADGWIGVEPTFENPDNVGIDYGGTEVADMDGDKKPDIIFASHGQGLAVGINKGDLKFNLEKRGLPRGLSSRAVAIGDIDANGKPDVVAISDAPEYVIVKQAKKEGNVGATLPQPDGYVPGIDVRAFLADGGRFVENTAGLEGSCYGYSIALQAKPADQGAPFLVTDCRYGSLDRLIYSFDRKSSRFKPEAESIMERWSYATGVAVGTYRGYPAAFVSYMTHAPRGATKPFSGDGVTVYYRDKTGWVKKRVFRNFRQPEGCAGLAVGDINGDGLDDVVYADDGTHRVRVFFQTKSGSFEELQSSHEPGYENHASSVRLADVDGDKRKDILLMYQSLSKDETRSGGLKVFRSAR